MGAVFKIGERRGRRIIRPQDRLQSPMTDMPIARRKAVEQARKLIESDEVLLPVRHARHLASNPHRDPEIRQIQEGADSCSVLPPGSHQVVIDHQDLPVDQWDWLPSIPERSVASSKLSIIYREGEADHKSRGALPERRYMVQGLSEEWLTGDVGLATRRRTSVYRRRVNSYDTSVSVSQIPSISPYDRSRISNLVHIRTDDISSLHSTTKSGQMQATIKKLRRV